MKAIVCVDLNWGIGFKGQLLARIPKDMKMFKERTIGRVVVMGRETLKSLPQGKPLKNRTNIVLSRTLSSDDDQIIVCRSIEDLLKELEKYDNDDVFIIGGEEVYIQLLPLCTEVYVTKINKRYEADRYFVNLDSSDQWVLVDESDVEYDNNISYSFLRYRNKNKINQEGS